MSAEIAIRLVLIIMGLGLLMWTAVRPHRGVFGGLMRLGFAVIGLLFLAIGFDLLPLPVALGGAS